VVSFRKKQLALEADGPVGVARDLGAMESEQRSSIRQLRIAQSDLIRLERL
jgi:hypothetical protein